MEKNENRNNEYTAEDIEVLGGMEAVRRRPGMYIGSTGQRGLHHLVQEIVYNSIDEAMAGSCDRVEVTIFNDGRVAVADNGRGIPVEVHPVTSTSALEAVMTMLHAGAKFGGRGYTVSGGLHGVGASVVNALSSELQVEVKRDGKCYRQEYCCGIPQNAVEEVGEASDTGTTTTFLADQEIFGNLNYDFDALSQRFREMCYLTKGLELHFEDKRSDREVTFYFEGGIASFARYLNKNRPVLHTPIFISKTVNGTGVEVALQYNEGFAETTYSFANCINTQDGGSHLTGFRTAITRVINDSARNLKLIKEDEANLIGDDTREGLVAIISVKLAEPQFEGQTKAKLGNPEIKSHVESAVADGLSQYLDEHPPEAKRIIEKCLTSARAREAARKARDLVLKKNSLEAGTLPGKLADCSDKDPAQCELYLVEGESAGGSAKQGRDRRFQAILPLKGKILNVEKASPEKMLAHEEIRAIITALGIGIDKQLDLAKLRYHRIIIMTDADVDGAHIRTLLLTFFFRHMTELISGGHLLIAQPPLYRLSKGKTEEWLYSEEEMERSIAKKAFEDLSVHSTDGSITFKGTKIGDLLDSLRELDQGLAALEKEGIPREISAILLMKDESFSLLDFSQKVNMQELSKWFEESGFPTRLSWDDTEGEYWIEVDLKGDKIRLDRSLLEHPILHGCFKAYPHVKRLTQNRSYTVVKKGKEIGSDIPWYELADVLQKSSDRSGTTIQRYKGLGEMSAQQLWETTMNPETRTMLQVDVEDAIKADKIFETLMGDEVPPRKAFIQAHAKSVKNLDI
ncbi:MAG: DNA topoisomerase (ATP-hydrolyzing) subunit B [Dehalococcoidia bacterium]|nr:MAG: DNA topoisomerase (ATP-hydrolyzing) subunit B [Dehalococcoidia bacterium]